MKLILLSPNFKSEIIRLNTIDQLFERGIDAEGHYLTSALTGLADYTFYTLAIKESKGQRTDVITLNDTGEFYASWDVKIEGDEFVPTADTFKGDNDLREVWGDDIIGLTDQNISIILEMANRIILEWTNNYLLGY